ncbi:protein of unknown function [Xenorhabdus poinarii G6]|uniref:Uncharacterized protein n=1 Tax=Xenorhabdus poinarii G6 TaxID=1354304 RepID=A0A068R0V5_9GAMM|nr:hypothetical protein [Xenorhabdus poinarii]CDG20927.1 protein of unknown function [Xenorhabdus poinarii G6]
MNTQDNKRDKTTENGDVLSDTSIREKQTGTLNQVENSVSNIFGFGYSHANFFNSHFGA